MKQYFENSGQAYEAAWRVLEGGTGVQPVMTKSGLCAGMQQVTGNARHLFFISEQDGVVYVEDHAELSADRRHMVAIGFCCVKFELSDASFALTDQFGNRRRVPYGLVSDLHDREGAIQLYGALGAFAEADLLDDVLAPATGPTNFMMGVLSRHDGIHPAVVEAVLEP